MPQDTFDSVLVPSADQGTMDLGFTAAYTLKVVMYYKPDSGGYPSVPVVEYYSRMALRVYG